MNENENFNKDEAKKMEDDFRFAFNPPIFKVRVRPNRESIKLGYNTQLFVGLYPRKVMKDDELKFLFLKKLLRNNEIKPERFVEFAKILHIKEKEEKINLTIGEILIF